MPDRPTTKQPLTLDLSASEVQLISTGRKVLLEAQEDAAQIEQLKQLIARLQHG
jgi:hypothetical protein